MRPKSLFAGLIFACLLPLAAVAQSITLQDGQALSAQFEQDRYLEGFNGATRSAGEFYLLPEKGVAWRTITPFASDLIVGEDNIRQMVQGQQVMQVPVSQLPGADALHLIFAAVLQGDWDRLEREFSARREPHEQGWKLTYVPPGRGPIRAIELTGADYIETAEIFRRNGDRDVIRFTGHRIRPLREIRQVSRLFR
ncbi:LolA family protein [Halocynthiibacter namhaensis]|uniref:LolA family protein n=1 Tax=Halocynthiibacter namhaensis TaxID=1290553 RepID=UPI0005794481|nr:hypothetical protein [Halocynthiibacter namhaensis]